MYLNQYHALIDSSFCIHLLEFKMFYTYIYIKWAEITTAYQLWNASNSFRHPIMKITKFLSSDISPLRLRRRW